MEQPCPLAGHTQVDLSGLDLGNASSADAITLWRIDPELWQAQACVAAGRNLTQEEWDEFFPGRTYEVTCAHWPNGVLNE